MNQTIISVTDSFIQRRTTKRECLSLAFTVVIKRPGGPGLFVLSSCIDFAAAAAAVEIAAVAERDLLSDVELT